MDDTQDSNKVKMDAFKLSHEIFKEIEGHRWNLPIKDFFETGKKCGFDHLYIKIIIGELKENNIIESTRAARSVRFTYSGYQLIQDTLNNPDNPPYYFPSISNII